MAVAGRKASVRVTGAAVALNLEPCTDVGGTGTLIQVTNSLKRVQDRTTGWTLYRDAVAWAGSFAGPVAGDVINRLNGSVALGGTPGGAGHAWTFTSAYLPLATVIEGKSWMYELSSSNLPKAQFLDIWQSRVMGLRDGKGKIGLWKTTDESLVNMVLAGSPIVVEFFDDLSLTADLRMWAQPTKAAFDALVANAVNHDWEFDGTTDVEGRMATNVP